MEKATQGAHNGAPLSDCIHKPQRSNLQRQPHALKHDLVPVLVGETGKGKERGNPEPTNPERDSKQARGRIGGNGVPANPHACATGRQVRPAKLDLPAASWDARKSGHSCWCASLSSAPSTSKIWHPGLSLLQQCRALTRPTAATSGDVLTSTLKALPWRCSTPHVPGTGLALRREADSPSTRPRSEPRLNIGMASTPPRLSRRRMPVTMASSCLAGPYSVRGPNAAVSASGGMGRDYKGPTRQQEPTKCRPNRSALG
eukprot:353540-Chlamydomonas_euryale.AAC.2